MNKRDKIVYRNEIWRKFHSPGCQNYCKRKKNAVFISPANSLKHEKAKLEVCWLLRKIKEDFITECVSNATGLRHDVVSLDTGKIYEIETTRSRSLRFNEIQKQYDVEIIVIKLWEKQPIKNYLN